MLPQAARCACWRGAVCVHGGTGVPGRPVCLSLRVGMGQAGCAKRLVAGVAAARAWPGASGLPLLHAETVSRRGLSPCAGTLKSPSRQRYEHETFVLDFISVKPV